MLGHIGRRGGLGGRSSGLRGDGGLHGDAGPPESREPRHLVAVEIVAPIRRATLVTLLLLEARGARGGGGGGRGARRKM